MPKAAVGCTTKHICALIDGEHSVCNWVIFAHLFGRTDKAPKTPRKILRIGLYLICKYRHFISKTKVLSRILTCKSLVGKVILCRLSWLITSHWLAIATHFGSITPPPSTKQHNTIKIYQHKLAKPAKPSITIPFATMA